MVKSRAARSAWMSSSRRRHEVDVPGVARADDAPRAEVAGEPERRAAGRARERARRGLRVAGQRDVEVDGVPAEQAVAHGAADDPGALARRASSRAAAPAGVDASRAVRGGARAARAAPIPQRDLVVDRPEPPRPLLGEHALARPGGRAARRRSPRGGGSGPRSTVTLSIDTVPTSGTRRPPTSTSQSFVSARRTPSA